MSLGLWIHTVAAYLHKRIISSMRSLARLLDMATLRAATLAFLVVLCQGQSARHTERLSHGLSVSDYLLHHTKT